MILFGRIRFHRPRKSRVFFVGSALLVVGLATAANAFMHPTTRSESFAAFTTSGAFSYTGQTIRPDPVVYPSGAAHTGEEIVIGDIDAVTMHFAYRFDSKLDHRIRGTIVLQDVFLGDSGWRNAYALSEPTPFDGDTASVTATLSLARLGQALAKLQAGSQVAARSYTVHLQAVVRYDGVVGNHNVRGTFMPTLPFTLDAAVFAPQALGLQGASTQAQALEAELHPTQTSRLQRARPNVISFLGVNAAALWFRVGGILLALIGLVVGTRSQGRRRDDIWSHEKRVAYRAGLSLIDVLGLEQTSPRGTITTEVPSFESLVALSLQTARPILREERVDGEIFGIEQPPRLFLYRKPLAGPSPAPAAATAAERMPAAEPAPPPRRRHQMPGAWHRT